MIASRGERGSFFGDPGLAQALAIELKLDQICRVVASRLPGGADGGDGEGRVEFETALDRGAGLVEPTKLREGGAK